MEYILLTALSAVFMYLVLSIFAEDSRVGAFFVNMFNALKRILSFVWNGGHVKKQVTAAPHKPYYKMYETSETIVSGWDNESYIGMCYKCGCDDSPILFNRTPKTKADWDRHAWVITGSPTCKWCAELERISLYIRLHGTAWMRAEMAKEFDDRVRLSPALDALVGKQTRPSRPIAADYDKVPLS